MLLIWALISLPETWPISPLPNQALTERSREQEAEKVFGRTMEAIFSDLIGSKYMRNYICVAMVLFC